MSFWEPFKNALNRMNSPKAILYFILLEIGIAITNLLFDIFRADDISRIVMGYVIVTAYTFLQIYTVFAIIYCKKIEHNRLTKIILISLLPAIATLETLIYNGSIDQYYGNVFLISSTVVFWIILLGMRFYPYSVMHGKPFMQAITEAINLVKQNFVYMALISIVIFAYQFVFQGLPQIFFEINTFQYGNESEMIFKGIELVVVTALVELYTTILLFEVYEKLTKNDAKPEHKLDAQLQTS